jgi:predicted nucleotidyltransferase
MNQLGFPTPQHQAAAEAIGAFFAAQASVDTVLVVNSCARGVATPDSDLDFAILMQPAVSAVEQAALAARWQTFAAGDAAIADYQRSGANARLHLDLITGQYGPRYIEPGGEGNYFELEVGNHVRYAAPLGAAGAHYQALRERWLPYYGDDLRRARLEMAATACRFDLALIPTYVRRGLHFYAFDRLYSAFQLYLQTLFIAHRIYPLAYNKWLKEQFIEYLRRPDLYPRLAPILSVSALESDELNDKARALAALLSEVPDLPPA